MKTISIALIILGVLILLVGLYFNFMQWPDLFKGTISGPILLFIGLVLFIVDKLNKK